MAQGQGKLKKKPASKSAPKRAAIKSGRVKKGGAQTIAPKRAGAVQRHQVKQIIEKSIHKSIETQLSARAYQVEEGKAFKILPNVKGASGKKAAK